MTGHAVFHAGERAVQDRTGMRERMAEIGPRVIRDAMPEQHRSFFAQLPFLVAGMVDAQGQPWASVLAAPAGFVQSSDARHLQVSALPVPGDPLLPLLLPGAPIGLLGIEPQTRRRNRVNGVVEQVQPGTAFNVRVQQSFGNCPRYIQAREPRFVPAVPGHGPAAAEHADGLDDDARRAVLQADTFFIATSHPGATQGAANPAHGVDVSHRGGWPGFVGLDAATGNTLTVPDFAGNRFFNTLGNIAAQPRAGLVFVDFDNGDLLYLSVQASIVWDGAELRSFEGAERLLKLQVRQMLRLPGALPLRWSDAEPSPALDRTGIWDAAARAAPGRSG